MIKVLFSLVLLGCYTGSFSQIWKQEPLHRLTALEYKSTLEFWEKKFSDRLTVEEIGKSVEGERIYMLKVTDPKVPMENKQVALVTALHGGPERSGTTSTLAFAEWILSNDREAVETRKKQLVLIIPIINPYSYFITDRFGNSNKLDPYTGGGASNWDFQTLTYKKADQAPELVAFLNVVDKYRPDVNLDMHGTGLQEYTDSQVVANKHLSYRGQIMFESTGLAYSNSSLRPSDWRVMEKMVAAGKEAGFPTDRGEADAQQMQWIPGTSPMEGQFWRGRPQFYSAQYGYLKYHTLVSCLEIAWEASGVARAKGMMRIGNSVWPGEKSAGYPVDKVHAFIGKYVTSWGKTASQRRNSRIDIWQKHAAFSHGIIYPETEGRESFVLGITPKGAALLDGDLEKFVSNLKTDKSINAKAIEDYIKKGPEIKLAFEKSNKKSIDSGYVNHGMGLRFRVPYANAKIKTLHLNGHPVARGADGYETWIGDGYLQVQVNVSPAKASTMDIAIVTCEYETPTKRTHGWKPPQEVLNALKKN